MSSAYFYKTTSYNIHPHFLQHALHHKQTTFFKQANKHKSKNHPRNERGLFLRLFFFSLKVSFRLSFLIRKISQKPKKYLFSYKSERRIRRRMGRKKIVSRRNGNEWSEWVTEWMETNTEISLSWILEREQQFQW